VHGGHQLIILMFLLLDNPMEELSLRSLFNYIKQRNIYLFF
jgi:hypothetical protein